MNLIQKIVAVTLVAGGIVGGVCWGSAEARENARLERQVAALDDVANKVLWQLAKAREENERLAKPGPATRVETGTPKAEHLGFSKPGAGWERAWHAPALNPSQA